MSNERDVSGLIETLEVFEDRMGIRFECLSAWCGVHEKKYEVNVGGELHLHDGGHLDHTIEIVADIYNESGQLIGTEFYHVEPDSFFGYEAFMICINKLPSGNLGKVRVYPKPARY